MTREEAIERIKSRYDKWALDDKDLEAIQCIFPELAESEDERIRNDIMEAVENWFPYERVEEIRAYLIKQKEHLRDSTKMVEQKPAEKSVIQEKGNEVMKAIEGVIRVYEKTQGGWIAGYDMDTLVVHLRKAFAALEKQKEQPITANDLDEEIHRFFDDCIDVYEAKLYGSISERVIPVDCYELTARHFAKWGEKQKERKSVHTAKEMWEEMRLEVYAQASGNRHEPNCSDDSTKMFSLCDIDEIFEKIGNATVGPQSAEWSEEDEDTYNRVYYLFRDAKDEWYKAVFSGCYPKITKDKVLAMLKSLRHQPQPKQEWSEENEDMLNCCISSIEEAKENRYAYKETDGDTSYDHEISWLKSLRPLWKPTEEHLSALLAIINDPNNIWSQTCQLALSDLYEQLKRLKYEDNANEDNT